MLDAVIELLVPVLADKIEIQTEMTPVSISHCSLTAITRSSIYLVEEITSAFKIPPLKSSDSIVHT